MFNSKFYGHIASFSRQLPLFLKILPLDRIFDQSFPSFINTNLWSKCNKAFSSGPSNTPWIWNLHDIAHDFDIQQSSTSLLTRKVFSSNVAHLSLVFFWIRVMHFHGAYFANYSIWLKDGKHYLPSSHLAYSLIGQDILNDHNSNQYSYAIRITSGWFSLFG